MLRNDFAWRTLEMESQAPSDWQGRVDETTGSINERITRYSMKELVFKRKAAAEYDRAFAHVTRYFMPFVLRTAGIARGMRVLDIAAGTGLSAETALSAVGPTGHVTAADISPA